MKENRRETEFVDRRDSNFEFQAAKLPHLPFRQCYARELMTLTLLLSDTVSLLCVYGVTVWMGVKLVGAFTFPRFWDAIPILALFLIVYALHGLYPGVGLSPVHEIKQLMSATNIVFLLLIALSFWEKTSTNYSRLILGAAWLTALMLVQACRWLARIAGRNLGIWGEPIAVVGTGPEGQHIVQFLKDRMRLGMRPVLCIDGFANYEDTPLVAINRSMIRTVVLVVPEMSADLQKRFINDQRFRYHRRRGERSILRIIQISSLGWWGSLGVKPVDLDGRLGLEIPNNLMLTWPRLIKRVMDLLMAVIGGLLISPFLLFIAVLIRLDSRGGVIYQQARLGRDGKKIMVYKFRTMQPAAEQTLRLLLESEPELKAEWESTQKLKYDPRITRVGKFLRKFSLDELPQLLNVIKGEMSIVGPRPIVADEGRHYKEIFEKYKKVLPGITGLWQVSGRNDTSYAYRVQLDEYYIHNWSPWLDIYIILRTAREVLIKRGAY